MERFFIFDKFNTWYNWRFYLTAKTVPDPEPKTNYVDLDGMSGTLDLSEALTGEPTYSDRIITATFWTDNGTRAERERLLKLIRFAIHGRKIKIIDPDDPDHYFYGRVSIKSTTNIIPYAEFTIEAVCDPWRYSLNETLRQINAHANTPIDMVVRNDGIKTLIPTIVVSGSITLTYNNTVTPLTDGTYKVTDIKLYHGVNIIKVSGNGSVGLIYREADL